MLWTTVQQLRQLAASSHDASGYFPALYSRVTTQIARTVVHNIAVCLSECGTREQERRANRTLARPGGAGGPEVARVRDQRM